ncbi:glycosyltransferase [Algoriphagus lacus]|uniref:Glycosyltransferase n=1 Tax=Algoriphagus lacus TaxID=2056311 RepID=A0A418PL53_9BACT|nr:glycosyltransferase family 2 protein [Algoriphagus lacus]RIW11792.1 glycosyltransferase [Algoriphagus lacus]
MKPKISIITVCFNCVHDIEGTILSVINQKYDNFEYIIVDGGSTDGTLDVIYKHIGSIDFLISERDKGIYDAMNKGIGLATGDWINFMNSGDSFYSNQVLDCIFSNKSVISDYALIYGFKLYNKEYCYPFPITFLKFGEIMANHQCMFFNLKLVGHDFLKYNLEYLIYADFDLVNRIYIKYGKSKFFYLNECIAVYKGGGVSSKISFQKRKDRFKILFREYGVHGLIRGLLFKLLNTI